jgi:hypothetical protein
MFARDDYSNYAQESSQQEWQEREESAERRMEAYGRYLVARIENILYPEPEPECPYCTSSAGRAVYGPDGEERCSECVEVSR